eukprot:jgi/Chlat1/4449/Chrsp29S04400
MATAMAAAVAVQAVAAPLPAALSLRSRHHHHTRPALRATRRPCRTLTVASSASPSVSAESRPITFHIGETSVTVPYTKQGAAQLNESISNVLSMFKEKEGKPQRRRLENMEYSFKGDLSNGHVFLDIVCNPNAYANAFAAKVLITVRDDRIKITSEGALSALQADVQQFLDS